MSNRKDEATITEDYEKYVEGEISHLDINKITPQSVVFNYNKEEATLIYKKEYNREEGDKIGRQVVRKKFEDVFLGLNKKVFASHNRMILPNGCIHHQRSNDNYGKPREIFLIQEQPGIRSFRLSNRKVVIETIQKMFGKFNSETKSLEGKKVEADKQAELDKTIEMRKQYLLSQPMQGFNDEKYKLAFRVFFPYTYILISVSRENKYGNNLRRELGLQRMAAMTTMQPVKTFDDTLYQFPLPNVNSGGTVCTGKLQLSEFGIVDLKSYVEKMVGYFWNNRFNGDIMTGPNLYGGRNLMGNWFEWEYTSYVNPSKIFEIDLNDIVTPNDRRYVYQLLNADVINRTGSDLKKDSIDLINSATILEGFKSRDPLSDSGIELNKSIAKKYITNISESIMAGSFDIKIGRVIATDKKKFRIVSYDGFKTYDINDASLIEKDVWVTHAVMKDQKGRLHRFPLNNRGREFILNGYQKQQKYEKEAVFPTKTFKSGELIGIASLTFDDGSVEDVKIDMISSIRDLDHSYLVSFVKRDKDIKYSKDTDPLKMVKLPISFAFQESINNGFSKIHIEDTIEEGKTFLYRTSKHITSDVCPDPFDVRDYFSLEREATAKIVKIVYKDVPGKSYNRGYGAEKEKDFNITYTFTNTDSDNPSSIVIIAKVGTLQKNDDNGKYRLILPLEDHIIKSGQDFVETTPALTSQEMVIFGERAVMGLPVEKNEKLPFRILRDGSGQATFTSVKSSAGVSGLDEYSTYKPLMFLPSVGHLATCIKTIKDKKTFRIKDLGEFDTNKKIIKFSVGDEVLLASDWNPLQENTYTPPSIKKIYDFIIVRDEKESNCLRFQRSGNDTLISQNRGGSDDDRLLKRYDKYKKYLLEDDVIKTGSSNTEEKVKKGTLYAVIDDGSDNLILHPMIDSYGQHFLNGISHVMKEIGDINAGDFVQATTPKISHFSKNIIEKVVGFVDINRRALAIFHSGMTMWYDILEDHFKVMQLSKLTAKRIEYLEAKKRTLNMKDHDVLYGDVLYTHVSVPIMTKGQFNVIVEEVEKAEQAYDDLNLEDKNSETPIPLTVDSALTVLCPSTLNLTKDRLATLIKVNGSNIFETVSGYIDNCKVRVHPTTSCSSFRLHFNKYQMISKQADSHIGEFKNSKNIFDVMYSIFNRSLKNGNAVLSLLESTASLTEGWHRYNSPYNTFSEHPYYSRDNRKMTRLTFPTPRILKKDTRCRGSYLMYKHMGPQNTLYNLLPKTESGAVSRRTQDDLLYATTSDIILPE